jgi:hypothetical protein
MNSTHHFLHIHHLGFPLEEFFLPLDSQKILWNSKSLKVPLVEIIFLETQDDVGLWILTTWPSPSYILAYCRLIHLISIEFQSIDNNPGSPPKTNFLSLQLLCSCNLCGYFNEIFSTSNWDSKVQNVMVGSRKGSYHFDLYPTWK